MFIATCFFPFIPTVFHLEDGSDGRGDHRGMVHGSMRCHQASPPSYQQFSILKMAVMGEEIIVEWFMEACDATKPASLWLIIQPAREITKCVKVPKFCHPKVVVNHSWEVLLDKNIPFLVFRGAHNWHKSLYTLH